jgi:UDP-N-acetylmuramoylalanine--D-glutamate ligase
MNAVSHKQQSRMDLVFGLGATGLSVARYLRRQGGNTMFIDTREAPPGLDELNDLWPDADVALGDVSLPAGIDRVIVSPGIPDSHPLLQAARDQRLEVVSDVELFVRAADAPFVAVTGSNGKSTVTTLLYHMCRAADRRTLAGGNLGEPALDLLGETRADIFVLALSSFQLQRTRALPAEVAVLLNVTPDHLDWHASEREYRSAKYRIYREARAAVVNRADPEALQAASGIARVVTFGLDEPAADEYGIRTEDGTDYLARGDALLLAASDLVMVGLHNRANALAALAAGELLGLEMTAMLRVLREFPGLAHRMQFVARTGAVDYINDSKATNVAAAVASIESIDGPVVLIAGGDGKGGDFSELADALVDKLRAAVLLGKDAERIAAALNTVMPVYFAQDMQDAVTKAATYAESDDTVLLAPACASLDQYANYGARGDAFCKAVRRLLQ